MSDDNKQIQDNATVEAIAENELLLAVKSGNRVDIANTYIADIVDAQKTEAKKKEEDFVQKMLLEIANMSFDDLMKELENIMGDIDDLLDTQRRLQAAYESGNLETWQLIMINERGYDPEIINNLTTENWDTLHNQEMSTITTEVNTLYDQMEVMIANYDEANGLTEEQVIQLQQWQAEHGVEKFSATLDQFREKAPENFIEQVDTQKIIAKNSTIKDHFNKAVNNEASNPFDLDNDNKNVPDPFTSNKSETNPFNTVSASPNPFG
ncbi:hypothetical protein DS884_07375 [Tenacibaculum sp. E3R01]|uniref:hypothetical protein n=1 Tax=Tenacibaculum sp. E3R01 TaxID=2267227 RepID=UPI000DEAFF31|nr:hypothetical protein [Tenacibaculum sp. E3R01]RBW59547.1 hypothetical protein DS884_07375 [Tenacibaculum sp. E3R01]